MQRKFNERDLQNLKAYEDLEVGLAIIESEIKKEAKDESKKT